MRISTVGNKALELLVHPRLTPLQFNLVFVVLNGLVFQAPLLRYLRTVTDLSTVEGWLTLATVEVVLAGFSAIALGLVSIVSLRLLKLFSALLLLCNSVALYFVNSFQVLLSREMMGNVFNTNFTEAAELYSGLLLLWVVCLGVLPAIWIWRVQWIPGSRSRRALMIPAVLAFMLVWVYVNSATWLWIDDHASRIGSLAMPWSYVGNAARYWSEQRRQNLKVAPLPALRPIREIPQGSKQVVVLVIGEAARSANFSLYGYPRQTNPLLAGVPLAVLPAKSCSTYTTASLECMLSAHGAAVGRHALEENLPTYLYRHGVDVEWRTNNFGEPKMQVGRRLRAGDLLESCNDRMGTSASATDTAVCRELDGRTADGALLLKLEARIDASDKQRILIVMHQSGSHGPLYHEKYPAALNVFTPVCRSTNLNMCTSESLLNAYDNSIVYTNHVLHTLITVLGAHPEWRSTVIYVSDHGESLGENGVYLHGLPNMMAPAVQLDIPFLVWRSDAFLKDRQEATATSSTLDNYLGRREMAGGDSVVFGHDNIFHSVLGALWLTSDAYQAGLDLFSTRH